MNNENFSDAVLVVLGHGTMQNANSAAPVYQHAAELRRRKIFAGVREAFWKQEPQIKRVLPEISAARVFIVPLFISEGYFSGEVIPRELGFTQNSKFKTQNSEWFYCRPVGTHNRMTEVLLARAREIVAQFPFPRAPKPKDITLFIAGHGTEKNENSRQAIERQIELIRAMNLYAGVQAVYLEESPRIADCYHSRRRKIWWWSRFSSVTVCTRSRTFPCCSARQNGSSNNALPPGSRHGVIRRRRTAAGLVFARHRQRTAHRRRDFGTGAGSGGTG